MDFFSKILEAANGCHIWTGAKLSSGYGRYSPLGRRSKRLYAHRFAWEMENGPIPDGLSVLHRCDNPSCVNPGHLFIGTQADNMRDMAEKRRSTFGEANPMAKLKLEDVAAIKASPLTSYEIAPRYGISAGHVRQIRAGSRWGNAA